EATHFRKMEERHFLTDSKLTELSTYEHIKRLQGLGWGDPTTLTEDQRLDQETLAHRYACLLSDLGRRHKKSSLLILAAAWAQRAGMLSEEEYYTGQENIHFQTALRFKATYVEDPFEFVYCAYAARRREEITKDISKKIEILIQLEKMVVEIIDETPENTVVMSPASLYPYNGGTFSSSIGSNSMFEDLAYRGCERVEEGESQAVKTRDSDNEIRTFNKIYINSDGYKEMRTFKQIHTQPHLLVYYGLKHDPILVLASIIQYKEWLISRP
ncbi:MAG: hypothetical protein GY915_05675, partial [bacterium]|nr:hypothetical protein [bacterium]